MMKKKIILSDIHHPVPVEEYHLFLPSPEYRGKVAEGRTEVMTVAGRLFAALLALMSLFASISDPALCQARDQMRQEVQSALERMTPEQIDQKLKELGITREEALARAQELGISLDDYLSRIGGLASDSLLGAVGMGNAYITDPRFARPRSFRATIDSTDLMMLAKEPRKKKLLKVPGFDYRFAVDSLVQPYGYDVFGYESSFFAPSASAAPPPSYALGPGDQVIITLWGETRLNFAGTISREGNLIIPDVGPVAAGGLTLEQFQQKLLKRMSSVYASLQGGSRARTFLDVSLGKLKNIQVFVVGEAVRPGGYSIPSMSTALTALYAAGGPTVDGSLREIAIIRKGERIAPVDLYGFLLNSERSSDYSLADGDIISIPPATRRVAVVGDVVHPAIYEVLKNESLGDLIRMAGGLRFFASVSHVYLERILPFGQRREGRKDVFHFDLEFPSLDSLLSSSVKLADGDVVKIFPIDYLPINRITIGGPVYKPGRYGLTPGMRVADLILLADSLRRSTFAERGTIERLLPNLRREVLSFNIRKALAGDEKENLLLQNEDSVSVYPEAMFFPRRTVTITGAVRSPGSYPRNDSMSVSDLIITAGGLTDKAKLTGIEIGRMDTTELGTFSRVYRVDLPEDYWREDSTSFQLKDLDVVTIPENPKYVPPKFVKISGYVMSPGTYTIRSSEERLADLFRRAGGLKTGAYIDGARLFRKFNNAGLVPLDFRRAIEDESSRDNVVLYDGDSVNVPLVEDVVYVSGEVFVPSPVLYKEGAGLGFYLDQAGGTKDDADEGRTVVMLPGGKKWEGGGIFGGDEILPGSTIFVPKKIEKEDKTLPILRDTATILASLAAITIGIIQITK